MLTRGWHTDLAVLRHTGSSVEDRGDHIVIRTPANPTFHWGNFVIVTDAQAVDDADRWVGVFAAEFPDAGHVALGLCRMPLSGLYGAHDLRVGTDEVLYTATLPATRPLMEGYTARAFDGDADWAQLVAGGVAENDRTGEYSREGHDVFLRARAAAQRAMCEAGVARWFGAFTVDGVLVSDLGIVVCDDVARYQSVGTDAAHRRRGLAGHLLGRAAQWAADQGCTQWVIVTETTNDAGRLYRSVGFAPDAVQVSAYRH